MALSVLNLKYRAINVDLAGQEQKSPQFLQLNPRGQVPVLIDDNGTVVWDSMAILVYLAKKYGRHLMRDDPVSLSKIMQWLAVSEDEIQYGLARARAYFTFKRETINLEEAQFIGKCVLDVLEVTLNKSAWLAADYFTIADIACYPYVALAEEGKLSLKEYPCIQKWMACIESMRGYVAMPGINPVSNSAEEAA
jgi:glutathione S-transferase